jgi:hypothetical protein
MLLICGALVTVATASVFSSPQAPGSNSSDRLVDLLVWGTHMTINPSEYSPTLKAEIERHITRFDTYRSERVQPGTSGELDMVYGAQVRYERGLVAVCDDPRAQALAVTYVDSLRPCYEWEGFHDCPEREAVFAEKYQTSHPDGPFSEYLPLLAAHRWLCTAEAYEYERRPEDAARSRRAYEQAALTANKSDALLIRSGTQGLMARGRCFSTR